MDMFNNVRRRLSLSPSRASTPGGPIRRPESSMSNLSKAEIDEILESPYETNYTYSDSVAYKPHIGSREYTHPRLCRRFPATPSPRPKTAAWRPFGGDSAGEWYRSVSLSQIVAYFLNLILTLTFTAMQKTFARISSLLLRPLRYIAFKVLQYTILWPILAPYYAIRSYWNKAQFVWRTSQSLWYFLRWTYYWWTGQKMPIPPPQEPTYSGTAGVQTRSMTRGQHIRETGNNRKYAAWLFLYLPLLILLLWTGYRLYSPKAQDGKQQQQQMPPPLEVKKHNETVQLKPEEEQLPKLKPSEQLPPHLARPIGGPPLNVQQEMDLAAQHPKEEGQQQQQQSQQMADIGAPFLSWFVHLSRPMSRFTEMAAHLGQKTAHGFEDIYLAFFTAANEMASTIFWAIKQTAIFIVNLPTTLFSLFWDWFCVPLARLVTTIYGAISQSLAWTAGKIASFSTQIWQLLRDSIFNPTQELAKRSASAVFAMFGRSAHYIGDSPARLWAFLSRWIFTPIASFINNAAVVSADLCIQAMEQIVAFPARLWHFLCHWLFFPVGQVIERLAQVMAIGCENIVDFFASVPGFLRSLLREGIVAPIGRLSAAIGPKLGAMPSTLAAPFKWAGNGLLDLGQLCSASLKAAADFCIETANQGWEMTKRMGGNSLEKVGHFLSAIGQWMLQSVVFVKNLCLQAVFGACHLFGWTGEKVIDGLIWLKDAVVNGFVGIGSGIQWTAGKVGNGLKYAAESILGSGATFGQQVAHYFWLTVNKVNSLVIWAVKSVLQIFSNIRQYVSDTFVGIWQSARQFRFSAPFTAPGQQPASQTPLMEPVEQVLSRSAELGELPDDHPFVRRLRQIVLQALAEERHFLDHRIRKWVEHNVLVMKSQLQRLEPKLVAETKEKVEAKIFPPPPPSEEEFREGLRAEWAATMREMLQKERTQKAQELDTFEQQLDKKIRLMVNQLAAQIRDERSQLDKQFEQLKDSQQELQENIAKKLAEEKKRGTEPLVKQQRLVEKTPEGKEVTKESTVLLQHIQQKIEEFDEESLFQKIRKLIKEELRRFDADRTGMPDFALESSGGSVLSTRCTVQYNEKSRTAKLFGVPLWYTSYSPRTVIQRKGYGASAGECWAYQGAHGFLTVGLSKRVNVTAVSYEHLPVELSPDGHIRTAPKNFLIWSYQEVDDMNSRLLLGNFTYDAQADPLQMFLVQQWDPRFTQIIELETLSNWGAPVTCLYRFRVHGDLLKVILEATEEDTILED